MSEANKQRAQFNIISSNTTASHGGFAAGTISMDSISPVIVDPVGNDAYIDMGALHAKSEIEKRIKFLPNKEAVPNGRPYWLVWVSVDRKEDGAYYAGVTACELSVDIEIRRGYKNLADHVNKMDKSMKRQIIVEHMDEHSKEILANFLKKHDLDMWNRSSDALKTGLGY